MKLHHIGLVFLTLIGLTGCFELSEQVMIYPDGSGEYALILDMKQSKNVINKKLSDSEASLVGLDSAYARSIRRLNRIKGVSNAHPVKDIKDYIFGIKFQFVNIDALNRALSKMNQEESDYPPEPLQVYDYTKRTFVRSENFYLKRVLANVEQNHEQESKNILQRAVYKQIIHTSEKFKKYTNQDYKLTNNKKTLTLVGNINEILSGKIRLGNEMKLKK